MVQLASIESRLLERLIWFWRIFMDDESVALQREPVIRFACDA